MRARLITAALVVAASLSWLLFPPRPAEAGSCGVVTHHRPVVTHKPVSYTPPSAAYVAPTYHAPTHHVNTIVAPVAVPVVVPAAVFQFLPAVGVVPAAPVAAAPVAAAPVATAPHAGPCPTAADLDRLISAKLASLLASAGGAPPPVTAGGLPVAQTPEGTPAPATGALPPAEPAPAAPEAPARAPAAGAGAGDAVAVLTRKCASCHTGTSSKGGFQIFAAPNQPAPLSPAQRAHLTLQADTAMMPPAAGGDPNSAAALSNDEIAALKAWAVGK